MVLIESPTSSMKEYDLIQSYPWIQWNIFYTLSEEDKRYKGIIKRLKNVEILTYCDGWIVVEDFNDVYLMNLNSSKKKKIKLPSVNFSYDMCILSCSPARRSSCYVLFIETDIIRYCRVGEKEYETCKLEEDLHIMDDCVAALDGKIYCVMESSFPNLVIIECNNSTLQFNKLETLPVFTNEVLSRASKTCYLVESGGELLLVLKSCLPICPKPYLEDVDFFLVFRFDFADKSWMQLDNIADFSIFLPTREWYGAVSFRSTEPAIKRNSIYFLQDDDEFVHVYDINNHSFTLLPNGCNRLKTLTMQFQEESNGNLSSYEEQNLKFLPQMNPDESKLVLARVFTLDPGALGLIRSVCKDWGSMVRPPACDIDSSYHKYPYLLTLNNGRCHFFNSTYHHTFCLDTPELLGCTILFSKFGWLLLSRNNKETQTAEYFFFNPFTEDKISIPTPDIRFQNVSFSSPPTSPYCFVVAVNFNGTLFAVYRYGEDSWDYCEARLPAIKRVVNIHPVFYKHRCYFIGRKKNLIVVDLVNVELSVFRMTFLLELSKFDECFLVKDGRGLLGVFLTTQKKTPYLIRMDLAQEKMKWQHVENFPNKMIYISRASCRTVSAPTTSTGNKIYFPLFRDLSCIFYSLSTGKYHSFLRNYSSETPFDVQWMTNCAWIDVD